MWAMNLKGDGNLVLNKHDDEYSSAYARNDKVLVSGQRRAVNCNNGLFRRE